MPEMCLDADMPPSPCPRECPDRSATCHAECAIYKQYFEECENIRKKKLAKYSLDFQRNDSIHRQEKKNHYHKRS